MLGEFPDVLSVINDLDVVTCGAIVDLTSAPPSILIVACGVAL